LSQLNAPLREMMSAVVDGEASEFELRRVLDERVRMPGSTALLARHFAVRAVLRGETAALCAVAGFDGGRYWRPGSGGSRLPCRPQHRRAGGCRSAARRWQHRCVMIAGVRPARAGAVE
jgi:hypothetical protein